jgi:hypothetical protein
MSESSSVLKIVGRGAVWPQVSLAEIAGEVFLEVEAGSTGQAEPGGRAATTCKEARCRS